MAPSTPRWSGAGSGPCRGRGGTLANVPLTSRPLPRSDRRHVRLPSQESVLAGTWRGSLDARGDPPGRTAGSRTPPRLYVGGTSYRDLLSTGHEREASAFEMGLDPRPARATTCPRSRTAVGDPRIHEGERERQHVRPDGDPAPCASTHRRASLGSGSLEGDNSALEEDQANAAMRSGIRKRTSESFEVALSIQPWRRVSDSHNRRCRSPQDLSVDPSTAGAVMVLFRRCRGR